MNPPPKPDANRGTLMLRLYRSVFHFAAALRDADHAARSHSDMEFIIDMRWRHIRHHPEMRITQKEYQRFTALAVRGGWDGTAMDEEERLLRMVTNRKRA